LPDVVMTKPATARPTPAGAPPARPRRRTGLRALWQSSIGKKWVMAVTGLVMLLFLLLHMLGNLKIFFGPTEFDDYAAWLRTIGEPVLHGAWFLWIQRVVLLVAVVLHVTAAAQLTRRDRAARPTGYAHGQRPQATFATRTMRYGGVILALFIVFHLLDMTAGVTNPKYAEGRVYADVYTDFQHWYIDLVYLLAMAMLGLHINHGFWSASQTLGLNNPTRDKAIKATGTFLAVIISVGFMMAPIGVMTGIVK
jgi:succinate dehydrogenase / fumarate reductase cytochrome b subunit